MQISKVQREKMYRISVLNFEEGQAEIRIKLDSVQNQWETKGHKYMEYTMVNTLLLKSLGSLLACNLRDI